MNFQTKSIIKAVTFSFIFLFSNHLVFSQIEHVEPGMINTELKYGEIVALKINEQVHFEDSLSITLTSFSHKRPFIGGPTKATAYIVLSKGNVTDEIMLSIHGIEGKSETDDGLSDSERYDSLLWNEYEFQLKSFDYDKSIEVVVYKKK